MPKKILSQKTKDKISRALKGKTPKNLDLFLRKGHEANLGVKRSEEIKKKMSESMKGKKKPPRSEEHRRKLSESKKGQTPWNKGLKNWMPEKSKESMIKSKLGKPTWNKNKRLPQLSGSNHPNWKGGISTENEKIRHSLEYKLWSDSVWNRDNNSCQKCDESRIKKLVAHHILNFSNHIELRFAIDNGITLCRKCHSWFHRKYGIKNNNLEQIKEFII